MWHELTSWLLIHDFDIKCTELIVQFNILLCSWSSIFMQQINCYATEQSHCVLQEMLTVFIALMQLHNVTVMQFLNLKFTLNWSIKQRLKTDLPFKMHETKLDYYHMTLSSI